MHANFSLKNILGKYFHIYYFGKFIHLADNLNKKKSWSVLTLPVLLAIMLFRSGQYKMKNSSGSIK